MLSRTEGVIMIIGAALYTGWIVVWTRRESQAVKGEYEHELGVPTAQRTRRAVAVNVTLLVAGIVVIVVGADLLVDGAVQIAQTFGVSDAVIGLTVVAVGTSAAELVTTMVSTVKDDRDIAIGNILGSSVYNILLNLGMTAVVAPVAAVSSRPAADRYSGDGRRHRGVYPGVHHPAGGSTAWRAEHSSRPTRLT